MQLTYLGLQSIDGLRRLVWEVRHELVDGEVFIRYYNSRKEGELFVNTFNSALKELLAQRRQEARNHALIMAQQFVSIIEQKLDNEEHSRLHMKYGY